MCISHSDVFLAVARYRTATSAATTGIETMEIRVEMQIPFETRVTSRLYSIQSIDTFPAIGQPERIVEISKSVRSLLKNLRTKNVISGRTRSFRKLYSCQRGTDDDHRERCRCGADGGKEADCMLREADIQKIDADREKCREDSRGEQLFDAETGCFLTGF